jgi:hypothetical protein
VCHKSIPDEFGQFYRLANGETFQTGARQVLDPATVKGWDAAEEAYDAIRTTGADIEAIAKAPAGQKRRLLELRSMSFLTSISLILG